MSAQPDLSNLRIARDEAQPSAKSRAWLWAVLVVAVVAAVGAGFALTRSSGVVVQIAPVVVVGGNAPVAGALVANGYVVAEHKAEVAPKLTGVLAELRVHEGSTVAAGEIIARIESRDFEAQLAAAKASLVEAEASLARSERDLERAKTLRGQSLVAESALQDAGTAADVARARMAYGRAQVDLAAANLESTRVRAPFAGTVLRKSAEVGELVGPVSVGNGGSAQGLVTLADLSALEVEADVNEAYIGRVKNDQTARVVLDAYADTSFAAQVRQVVPTADRQKATVQVKVRILDHDARILPEMAAKVTFLPAGSGVSGDDKPAEAMKPREVLVPSAAIIQDTSGPRVFVVEAGVAKMRPLKLGAPRGTDTVVEQGLQGGESVILSPAGDLQPGTQVSVLK